MCREKFSVIVGHLYKMGSDEILRQYLPEFGRSSILVDTHRRTAGVHYVRKETTQKILHVGLGWPTLHQGSKVYCKECEVCQRTGRPSRRDDLSLNT